jgi:hypothetical protein
VPHLLPHYSSELLFLAPHLLILLCQSATCAIAPLHLILGDVVYGLDLSHVTRSHHVPCGVQERCPSTHRTVHRLSIRSKEVTAWKCMELKVASNCKTINTQRLCPCSHDNPDSAPAHLRRNCFPIAVLHGYLISSYKLLFAD